MPDRIGSTFQKQIYLTSGLLKRLEAVQYDFREALDDMRGLTEAIESSLRDGEPLSPFLQREVETWLREFQRHLEEAPTPRGAGRDISLSDLEELAWRRGLQFTFSREDWASGRQVPIAAYFSDGKDLKAAYGQLDGWLAEILSAFDGELLAYEAMFGSLFARGAGRATADAIEKAADALKAAVANLPQAQANSENADAISKLLAAIMGAEEAAVAFGPVLVLKVEVDGRARVLTTDLSKAQQRELMRHPNWLLYPQGLLDRLEEVEHREAAERDGDQSASSLPPPAS